MQSSIFQGSSNPAPQTLPYLRTGDSDRPGQAAADHGEGHGAQPGSAVWRRQLMGDSQGNAAPRRNAEFPSIPCSAHVISGCH